MTDRPKGKRGPKPTGKPRARGINFSVSAEHEAWLKSMNDRSAWLAEIIEKVRKNSDTSAHTSAEKPAPRQDAEK